MELEDDGHGDSDGLRWIKCSNMEKKKEKKKNPMEI